MPPLCRERWPQKRVKRGSRCCNWASSTCNFPSRVRARCAKISRISAVRSSTLQPKTFSKFRLCAGESSSSNTTVSTLWPRQKSANSRALPLPMKVPASGFSSFCVPVPITSPPAVAANSANSSMDSRICQLEPDLSSRPMRNTRSVFLAREMSAFNSYDRRAQRNISHCILQRGSEQRSASRLISHARRG